MLITRNHLLHVVTCFTLFMLSHFPFLVYATEVAVKAVSVSSDDGNVASNMLDDKLNTRWSAYGVGEWAEFVLPSSIPVNRIDIAWFRGDLRVTTFDIEVWTGSRWKVAGYQYKTSGNSLSLEGHTFDTVTTEKIRIVGKGNSENDYISITEIKLFNDPQQSDSDSVRLGVAKNIADLTNQTIGPVESVTQYLQPTSSGGHFDVNTGKWTDIDYQSMPRATFPGLEHISRLKEISVCYMSVSCSEYQSESLLTVLSAGLNHFAEAGYDHPNWWFDWIGIPHNVGELLNYIYINEIPVDIASYQKLVDASYLTIRSHWAYGAGANSIDIAYSNILSGIVRKTDSFNYYVLKALEEIGKPNIGINSDQSFFAHGPMLNTNAYGTVLVSQTLKIEALTRGYFSFPDSSASVLTKFIDEGIYPTFRGRYHDYLTGGRGGVSRQGNLGRGFSTSTLASINPERRDYFEQIDKVTSGVYRSQDMPFEHTKGYWQGDYLLRNTPAFQYSSLTHSARTLSIEQGNGENLLGALMSEGSHSVRVRGDEYFDIFPLWDWLKIPGVTGREGIGLYSRAERGTPFSGVMSAESNGIMVHTQDRYGLQLEKGHFVFSDAIIVLGSTLSATEDGKVTTSLEQSWNRGDTKIKQPNNGLFAFGSNEQTFVGTDLSFIHHNGIGYYPLDDSEYHVAVENRTGKWTRVNSTQSDADLSGSVFSLWIDHGTRPDSEIFAYAIVPGISTEQAEAFSVVSRFVTHNTESLQGAYDRRDDVLQVIFRDGGQLEVENISISSNVPGMAVITGASSPEPKVYFADPARNFSEAVLSVTNQYGSANTSLSAPDYGVTNVVSHNLALGENTYIRATDDAMVRYGNYGNTNYGFDTNLSVKEDSSGYKRHILLKFPISSINDAYMESAELKLHVLGLGNSVPLSLHEVEDTLWREETVTANSIPDVGKYIGSTIYDSVQQSYHWDLSQFIREAKQSGKTFINLLVKGEDYGQQNWVTFSSDEASSRQPQIVVTEGNLSAEVWATEDAYVRGGNFRNESFGEEGSLVVKNDPNSEAYSRETFIKFPLHHLNITSITQAKLVLNVTSAGRSSIPSEVSMVGSHWYEENITYLTRPTEVSWSVPETLYVGRVEIDVTDAVNQALSSNEDFISLRIQGNQQSIDAWASILSKEAESDDSSPKLLIEH